MYFFQFFILLFFLIVNSIFVESLEQIEAQINAGLFFWWILGTSRFVKIGGGGGDDKHLIG